MIQSAEKSGANNNLEKRSLALDLTAHHFEDIGMNLIPDLWPHVPQKWAAQCTATACASALPFFRNDTRFARETTVIERCGARRPPRPEGR